MNKCENCDNLGLYIKVLPIFRLYQKDIPPICFILHQFNLYILLICGKKLVTINKSTRKGVFPRNLKTGKICPVYKGKGSKTDPDNYTTSNSKHI